MDNLQQNADQLTELVAAQANEITGLKDVLLNLNHHKECARQAWKDLIVQQIEMYESIYGEKVNSSIDVDIDEVMCSDAIQEMASNIYRNVDLDDFERCVEVEMNTYTDGLEVTTTACVETDRHQVEECIRVVLGLAVVELEKLLKDKEAYING